MSPWTAIAQCLGTAWPLWIAPRAPPDKRNAWIPTSWHLQEVTLIRCLRELEDIKRSNELFRFSCPFLAEEDRLFVSGMPPTAVDLSHAGSTCEPIAAQLADRQFGVMMKSKLGYPIACGGSEPSCEKYNPESGSWELMPESMSSSRQYGRAVLINDGQDYWITGT